MNLRSRVLSFSLSILMATMLLGLGGCAKKVPSSSEFDTAIRTWIGEGSAKLRRVMGPPAAVERGDNGLRIFVFQNEVHQERSTALAGLAMLAGAKANTAKHLVVEARTRTCVIHFFVDGGGRIRKAALVQHDRTNIPKNDPCFNLIKRPDGSAVPVAAQGGIPGYDPKDFELVRTVEDPSNLSREQVRRIQKGLLRMGFDPKGVDGAMGGNTQRAIRQYQNAIGREVTGRLTKQQAEDLITLGSDS